jgi:hypothetical protein
VSALPRSVDVVLVVPLGDQAAQTLRQPIVGRGGFQTLFRRIQTGLVGDVLTVTEADYGRLIQMARGERLRGGYQHRARTVIGAIAWWRLYGRPRRLRLLPFARPTTQLTLPMGEL